MAQAPRPVRPRLVTLTSDLGAAYAAQMKAVLARSLSPGRVVDLAHDLRPHAVDEAAFLVRAMARGFPAGTVHLVVVDPGVGGGRAPIAIECSDTSRLVGPDNGVLMPLAHELGTPRAVRIEADRVRSSSRVGTTFDGRDLFAPAAALLARGIRLARLGPSFAPVEYRIPEPTRERRGARGEVVHVDHFGNLITNIPSEWIPRRLPTLRLVLKRAPARSAPWVTSYDALGVGRLGALPSSFGLVELTVGRGRADVRLGARVGTPVRFSWFPTRRRRQ